MGRHGDSEDVTCILNILEDTNSGIPKLSSSVELLMLTGLLSLESGQPELPPPLDQGPLSSSRLGELAEFLAPGALENSLLSLLIIWSSRFWA